MPVVTIDGKKIEVENGTTILNAARKAGIEIPVFCYHEGLSVAANCRMCLVEVKGAPKLLPSCEVVVRDGMEVQTASPAVLAARRSTLELILLNHPVDCPICDQAGECMLQDNYFKYSGRPSRSIVPKVHKDKAVPIGPNVILDKERCINCTRCVRFTREVSKTNLLSQVQRGNRTEIAVFPGRQFDDPYSLCTVDLCPVGALTSRDFRFKERAWRLVSTNVICPECATGCNLYADTAGGRLLRLRPRFNPDVNRWWACDMGRLAFHKFEQNRVEQGRVREHLAPDRLVDAREAAAEAGAKIRELLATGGRIAMVVAGTASLEEMLVSMTFARQVLGESCVYSGMRPDGVGDHLLLNADRNPNRAGFNELSSSLGMMTEDVSKLFSTGDESSHVKGFVSIGSDYPLPRLPEGAHLETAVVLTATLDEVSEKATILIPTPAHYEKTGHYINAGGRIQASIKAVQPPKGALSVYEALSIMASICGKSLGIPKEPDGAAATAALARKEGVDA